MRTKKGFTLIEVVVALGILAIVFAGVITLVIQVVNLELGARRQTEAVALAQGKLAEQAALLCSGCTTNNPTAVPDTNENGYTYNVNFYDNQPETDFITIKVYVTWEDKGLGTRDYTISQIVRKK